MPYESLDDRSCNHPAKLLARRDKGPSPPRSAKVGAWSRTRRTSCGTSTTTQSCSTSQRRGPTSTATIAGISKKRGTAARVGD